MDIIHNTPKAQKWLKENNYPYTDYVQLQKSAYSFENGGLYGIEIPVINSFDILNKTINWLAHYEIRCDRFNETKGAFLLSENEIKDMLALCHEKKIGMILSLSPRPEYDTKATFYRCDFGLEQARQLNNNDAISYAVEEALYLSELGCRGLIIYDIGVLHVLAEMRAQGYLPSDLYFKASSHCMITNPVIAKIFQVHGANSVTMVHDVSLGVLQETRRLCPELLLDVSIDAYRDKGGFIRYAEIAQIVQICSPIMLKLGASAQHNPHDIIDDTIIQRRVYNTMIALEHLKKRYPKFILWMKMISFAAYRF